MAYCLFSELDFIGVFWQENGRDRHAGTKGCGDSKPSQKVGSLDGPFGFTVISQTCTKIFQA